MAARIKQLAPGSPLVGEEWISGPWAALTYANALGDTLARLERGQDPLAGSRSRNHGERTARHRGPAARLVRPSAAQRLPRRGMAATRGLRRPASGSVPARPDRTQGAALVLGAGNIFSIAPLDALYQLYAENRTVALKLNPITDPLKPVFEKIFAPFIDLGVIEILTGGVEIGGVLAHHPQISAVHMTGSEQTHDAIVWGPGQAGRDAKAAGTPKLTKPITSELGGVAPVIVVPGPWSAADLRFQARHVATQRLHNAGFELHRRPDPHPEPRLGPEVRLPRRAAAGAGSGATADPAGTPGRQTACARPGRHIPRPRRSSTAAPAARCYRVSTSPTRPRRPSPPNTSRPCSVRRSCPGPGEEFLDAAVAAANDRLHGTLGANIIIHPDTRRALGEQVRAPHRRAALRDDRDQRVDRCRLPRPVRDVGSLPRTHPRRRAERHRRRAQRVPARRHRADGRHGPVPTGAPVAAPGRCGTAMRRSHRSRRGSSTTAPPPPPADGSPRSPRGPDWRPSRRSSRPRCADEGKQAGLKEVAMDLNSGVGESLFTDYFQLREEFTPAQLDHLQRARDFVQERGAPGDQRLLGARRVPLAAGREARRGRASSATASRATAARTWTRCRPA